MEVITAVVIGKVLLILLVMLLVYSIQIHVTVVITVIVTLYLQKWNSRKKIKDIKNYKKQVLLRFTLFYQLSTFARSKLRKIELNQRNQKMIKRRL